MAQTLNNIQKPPLKSDVITKIIRETGLTQKELAESLGYHESTISQNKDKPIEAKLEGKLRQRYPNIIDRMYQTPSFKMMPKEESQSDKIKDLEKHIKKLEEKIDALMLAYLKK